MRTFICAAWGDGGTCVGVAHLIRYDHRQGEEGRGSRMHSDTFGEWCGVVYVFECVVEDWGACGFLFFSGTDPFQFGFNNN